MSKEQDNIDAISKVIDDGVDTFLDGVEKSQSGMFNKTLTIVKELETDVNGNIKQTVKNLKLLTRVRKTIVNEILTESYQKRVNTFSNQYPAIQALNNGYFKGVEAAFEPNRELYKQIVQKSIQTTRASLLDSGIDQNVIEPIIRIVDDSVSTGATFTDMVDELRTVIKGDSERLGRLARYSSQITTDALNQFNGIYNETIAKDLDLEWYYYSGGKRRTSRPFCKKYAGRYFHKKEVEDFGRKKDLDGSDLCGGSSKTDLCAGRIPGTNSSSIFRYRAGYNCKHVYKPTTIAAVPKHVVDRNIKKGYHVPEGEEGTPIVETTKFVPAKTIKEAEQYAKNVLNIDLRTKPKGYGNVKPLNETLSVKDFNQINKTILNLKNKYPVYSKNLKVIQIISRDRSKAFASRLGETGRPYGISINNKYFLDDAKRKIARQKKWSVSSKIGNKLNELEITTTHEYAHSIQNYIQRNNPKKYNEWVDFASNVNPKNVSNSISGYATTSQRELFAETFTQMEFSKGTNEIIEKLKTIIQ
jgi:hypothetical protein